MKSVDTVFGRIVADENAPKDTIFLVPTVTRTRYVNVMTGEVKEIWEWNSKAAGVITNVRP